MGDEEKYVHSRIALVLYKEHKFDDALTSFVII